jgi:uncharacterized Zn finger protein
MSQWGRYVPVAERRKKAERAMAKLRKAGHPVLPIVISGRTIATTAWGKAWCSTMESFGDYNSRLPRGRTYARNGSVVDLQITSGQVTAKVAGSSLYTVKILIEPLPKAHWRGLREDCANGIDSLVDLLQGKLSKPVMERLCQPGTGLFPKPSEIKLSCTCLDWASMCKHVAATVYGIGARLDQQPELLFVLRGVNHQELIANIDLKTSLAKPSSSPDNILKTDDMAALFGLDMEAPTPVKVPIPKTALATEKKRGARKETKI